ncbi:DgyrCDS2941 [Dimorphilus gyrociliatus]|uniref:DgyrCDS2941 n=1 Tax=Dimorphilus gyrociliatus TaxID=2664684 RepID=A0A7I8VEF8_9ANNE|nr:DgyrCDS2941 [Dimorphilus gyrociliatus]
MLTLKNFINGEFYDAEDYLESENPSTGKIWAQVPNSNEREVNEAVNSAKNAFHKWSNISAQERSRYLMKIAELLEKRLEEFAIAESTDQGKPVSLARAVDIPRAVYNFRFFASVILHNLEDSVFQEEFGTLNYTQSCPVGVAGLISPWNLPLYLLTWKIAPAIAAGCTVVCKPSEMTSVTAFMLCEVLKQAELPDGVVNIVFGTGNRTGNAIVKHRDVPLISFTGSTVTASRIREGSTDLCKKFSFELGGKNAAIVFKDANLENCFPVIMKSSYANQGEICLCTSRIYVQEEIFEQFISKYIELARNIKVGDPEDPNTNMGALISRQHYNKVKSYIDLSKKIGGKILCGDGVDELKLPENCKDGYFILPTAITNVADDSPLMQEEIFGPVTCIVPFKTEEEVIKRANNSDYGLCASIWSENVGTIHRVAKALNVGTVWANCWLIRNLNMPFGGMKESGTGREGAKQSLDFFTEKKTICVKIK